VNLFWTRSPNDELAAIGRLLAADGALYLFYEAPSTAKAASIAEKLIATLPEATLLDGPSPSLIGVVARA
jgi:hypothetical protein